MVLSMMIVIQGRREKDPYGKIVNFYLEDPENFRNAGELVMKMDEICGRLECEGCRKEAQWDGEADERIRKTLDAGRRGENSRAGAAGELLIVEIEHRNHASLQGRVRGKLTGWKYVSFKSGLELMRMVHVEGPADKKKD